LLFFIIFTPESPKPPSASTRDPTGFGVGYGAALNEFTDKVVKITFGIVTVLTVLIGISMYKKRNEQGHTELQNSEAYLSKLP